MIFFKFLFIDFRDRKEEKDILVAVLILMHSLVDSCICPGCRSNPQHWLPTELPSQGLNMTFLPEA